MTKTIDIDCPPGNPRPGDLIASVIEGTGLPLKESSSRCFGNWTWNYSEVPDDEWQKAQPILKQRLTHLYESGVVRYASW